MRKGVPADKADKVVKLAAAYDGNIDAVLADFPELVKAAPAAAASGPAFGDKTNPQQVNEAEKLKADVRKAFGLP